MDDDQKLVAAGELGDKIDALLKSDLGQYLLNSVEADKSEAIRKMMELDPHKYTTLIELQNIISQIQEDVILSGKVQAYLGDAIIRGQQADELLMTKED